MAQRSRSKSPSFERLLHDTIDSVVETKLQRTVGGPDAVLILRELRVIVARLERRVDMLSRKVLGSQPAPKRQSRRDRGPGPGRPVMHETCTRRGCNEPHYAKGLCSKHYQAARRAAAAKELKAKVKR